MGSHHGSRWDQRKSEAPRGSGPRSRETPTGAGLSTAVVVEVQFLGCRTAGSDGGSAVGQLVVEQEVTRRGHRRQIVGQTVTRSVVGCTVARGLISHDEFAVQRARDHLV